MDPAHDKVQMFAMCSIARGEVPHEDRGRRRPRVRWLPGPREEVVVVIFKLHLHFFRISKSSRHVYVIVFAGQDVEIFFSFYV
jgi:hypothetical protein